MLLVAFDVQSTGALASVVDSAGLLAAALVLAPVAGERTIAAVEWSLASGPTTAAPLRSAAARTLAGNAMAGALPLLEAIATLPPAGEGDVALALPLSPSLALALTARSFAAAPACVP